MRRLLIGFLTLMLLQSAPAVSCFAATSSAEVPDPHTTLPAPKVEMDVVNLLADFPKAERPYVQQVVHTIKEMGDLNKNCAAKAASYWEKGMPKVAAKQSIDPAEAGKFTAGYLRYFDPLRYYMKEAYRRLYGQQPPARFEKAHKYLLAYLAYALDNLDNQRLGLKGQAAKPAHSAVEVTQYRAWAYRLYKENGLDLTPYLVN
jgi:hypothetical protein